MTDQLKPCPFCGVVPEIEMCGGFPCVAHDNPECIMGHTRGVSVEVWNCRASPWRPSPPCPVRTALDDLLDVQNGVPLLTERDTYLRAVAAARAALAAPCPSPWRPASEPPETNREVIAVFADGHAEVVHYAPGISGRDDFAWRHLIVLWMYVPEVPR